jgi:hypothetical protein
MTTTVNDPKGEAGSKKAPMWLLPPVALEQTAWVHKLGNDKYGPFNWRVTGVCATTYVSAIMRHLNAWRDGEDLDPESGISHIAHIATSCNILMDAAACGTLQDDRNKRPGAGIHGLGFRVYPDTSVGQTTTVIGHKQIEVGGKLVDLPPIPEGYSRWVDRGMGWDTGCRRVPCFACAWSQPAEPVWKVYYDDTANGVDGSHYIEAIKDVDRECQFATVAPLPSTAVRVTDLGITPGDKVMGRLVHGEDFTGTVANIVDVRGVKVFQFLDRASISEDEIYSITYA